MIDSCGTVHSSWQYRNFRLRVYVMAFILYSNYTYFYPLFLEQNKILFLKKQILFWGRGNFSGSFVGGATTIFILGLMCLGRQWSGIFHFYWWTTSIKLWPRQTMLIKDCPFSQIIYLCKPNYPFPSLLWDYLTCAR